MTEAVSPTPERTTVLLDGVTSPSLTLTEALLPDSRYEIVEVIGTGRQIGEDVGWMLGYGTIGLRVTSRSAARSTRADVCVFTAGDDAEDLLARAHWAFERQMDVLVLAISEVADSRQDPGMAELHEAAIAAERTVAFADVEMREDRRANTLTQAMSAIQSAQHGLAINP